MKKIIFNLVIWTQLLFPAFTFSLLAEQQQEKPIPSSNHKKDVVNLFVSVANNKGQLVNSLSKENFEVEEDEVKQEIKECSKTNNSPLTIALIIDSSTYAEPRLDVAKQKINEFLKDFLQPKDLISVISFDISVSLIQDLTSDVKFVQKTLKSISANGGCSLHDAIYLACNEVLKDEIGHKIIILVGTGIDSTSKVKMENAIETSLRNNIAIYTISIPGIWGASNSGVLEKYAETTGGRYFPLPKSKDLKISFDSLKEELRNLYLLTYISSNPNNEEKPHKIKVKAVSQDSKTLKTRVKKAIMKTPEEQISPPEENKRTKKP